jgi:hypothetical protein
VLQRERRLSDVLEMWAGGFALLASHLTEIDMRPTGVAGPSSPGHARSSGRPHSSGRRRLPVPDAQASDAA